jgi:hypothetical protein
MSCVKTAREITSVQLSSLESTAKLSADGGRLWTRLADQENTELANNLPMPFIVQSLCH